MRLNAVACAYVLVNVKSFVLERVNQNDSPYKFCANSWALISDKSSSECRRKKTSRRERRSSIRQNRQRSRKPCVPAAFTVHLTMWPTASAISGWRTWHRATFAQTPIPVCTYTRSGWRTGTRWISTVRQYSATSICFVTRWASDTILPGITETSLIYMLIIWPFILYVVDRVGCELWPWRTVDVRGQSGRQTCLCHRHVQYHTADQAHCQKQQIPERDNCDQRSHWYDHVARAAGGCHHHILSWARIQNLNCSPPFAKSNH